MTDICTTTLSFEVSWLDSFIRFLKDSIVAFDDMIQFYEQLCAYITCDSVIRLFDEILWYDSFIRFIESIPWNDPWTLPPVSSRVHPFHFISFIHFRFFARARACARRLLESIIWFDYLTRFYDSIHWCDSLINVNNSIHAFIHSFIYSFIHSFIHASIHSFIHSYIHLFFHSFIHSFFHFILFHSFIHAFIHSFSSFYWHIL